MLERELDAVGDRVDLAVGAAGEHELVVAERAQLADVEQDRLERLLVERRRERAHRAVEAFGAWSGPTCSGRFAAAAARLRLVRAFGGAASSLWSLPSSLPYVRTCPLPRTTNLVVVRPSAPIGP